MVAIGNCYHDYGVRRPSAADIIVPIVATAAVIVALGALASVPAGASNAWWDVECGPDIWGRYVCWDKLCHLEEVCTHLFDKAVCHLEEVCTHFVN